MTERDRVFDAFRNCITEPKCMDCPWESCEAIGHQTVEIPTDLALAVMRMLAAQEPRVMTLGEACGADECWLERKDFPVVTVADVAFDEHPGYYVNSRELNTLKEYVIQSQYYGKYWRCWTARPTDEQREAVPWE